MLYQPSSISPDGQYNVYKLRFGPVMADSDVPGTRYHTVIFVETSAGGEGRKHHVVGDLVAGMQYESKESTRPEDDESFHSKELLGTVKGSVNQTMDDICRRQPPPLKQKAFNARTVRTEPVKPDG